MPTVLVEAMFCSNAIISYNCNYGPSDIVKKNSGFLIDVNNKEDFIQKLKMLANSDEKLEKMMENASKEAQTWRDEGKISFSQVGNKIYYKLSDVEKTMDEYYNKSFSKKW